MEPSVYFFENRCGSYGDFVFSRDICGWKSSKSFPGEKSGARWDFDASYGDASYGSRLFLLLLFSRRRPVGAFLFEEFGFKVVQTWIGCVIAAIVISFPLMYRNARAAMEQIDVNLVYAGRTLGMSETKIFGKSLYRLPVRELRQEQS